MLTALLLIFDPSGTWERIASTPQQRVWRMFLSYLFPLLFLSIACEALGLLKFGMNEGGLLSRVVKPSQDLVVRYETAQIIVDLLVIFGGAWLLKKIGEGFHRRHTYSECFATLGHSLGPLYLLRMLDAVPAINTWLCYGVGILLVVSALYGGVARVMKPDPSNALGVYLMASLVTIAITGIGHYLVVLVLDEKILVAR
jgi:hypothetical protein